MDPREAHIHHLRAAEGQFRLATAVRLAVTLGEQPLDLPLRWSHGQHTVRYSDIALTKDAADFAAWNLQRSATFLMASAALEAIRAVIPSPKSSPDAEVAASYQIARMVRNAFAHNPFNPAWRIDADCVGRVFELPGRITLDCTDIDGKPFDWRHYGGPLALLELARYVRKDLLNDSLAPEEVIPLPGNVYIQQGDLILKRVDSIPEGAQVLKPDADGVIDLGGGHTIRPTAPQTEE
jgi:hypothetical protein